jgi:DNA polymerase III delta prime subunit
MRALMAKKLKWDEPANLPQALAYCTIRRALRPYLRRDVGFGACFVVEPHHVSIYENIAERIVLRRSANGVRRANDSASVTTVEKRDVIHTRVEGNLQGYRRAVFIWARDVGMPDSVKASFEVFQDVGDPDSALMRSAMAVFYGRSDDIEDEVVLTADWRDLATIFRKGRSPRQSVARLKAVVNHRRSGNNSAKPTPRDADKLKSLHGYGEATPWGLDLVRDLDAYKAGTIAWADVERGLLLFGPPGVGKTTFGRKLAEACGVPFFHGSYSKWQSEGHQGEMLAAMRKTFQTAVNNAPCILLIDELESFTRRDRKHHHSDYMRGVVNGLLELLDGVDGREGVVVIGASNAPDEIDAAILRAGRIDTHVEITAPDDDARCRILEDYLGWPIPASARSEIGEKTEGLTGADLEKVARGIRRAHKHDGRTMDVSLITTFLPAFIQIPSDRLYAAAVHECGHTVVGLCHKRTISRIRLVDRILEGAGTTAIGLVEFGLDKFRRQTPQHLLEEIAIMFGGMAAESEIVDGGHDTGAGGGDRSDLVIATDLATKYEAIYGMGETLVSERLADPEYLAQLRRQNFVLWNRIDALLSRQLKVTRDLVAEHRGIIEGLADRLLQVKSMSGDEVLAFVQQKGFPAGQIGIRGQPSA